MKAPRWPEGTARPLRVRGKMGRRPKAARPFVYAANGDSSLSGEMPSSVAAGAMLAERSKATRAAAFTLPTPPRDVYAVGGNAIHCGTHGSDLARPFVPSRSDEH